MRTLNTAELVAEMANRSRTPVMAIVTDGSNAASTRYLDIEVDEKTRSMLIATDRAFLVFDSVSEANARFDMIVLDFPEAGRTTLGIDIVLAMPGRATRSFSQHPGMPMRLAA